MIKTCLARNTVRDRVAVKEAFALFTLATGADYVLDTNIVPTNAKNLNLKRFNEFKLVKFKDEGKESADYWMMYAADTAKPQLMLKYFLKEWQSANNECKDNLVEYHKRLAPITADACVHTKGKFGYWKGNTDKELGKSSMMSSVTISELGIKKYFYNTHTPETFHQYHDEKMVTQYNLKVIPSDWDPILVAIEAGDSERVRLLTKDFSDIDQLKKIGGNEITYLHFAIFSDKWDCVNVLLKNGADPKIKAKWGEETLSATMLANKLGVGDFLEKEIRKSQRNDDTPALR